ncbi:MAG: DEAD/DEAH box helicase family protein [bacterium]|nr:DEAD/DEAH box helicase family protein [bacterium]
MAFRGQSSKGRQYKDPEELFRDLKQKTSPGLISHQSEMIRRYVEKHQQTTDVAFQLPTGSGKTLVGLLIGEWRRVKNDERVLYLCPTNQLVRQVVDQAKTTYGISALEFTGSQHNYSSADTLTWESCEQVGVTSYSALFNTNPYFSDADVLILDDAHACEGPIASLWTVDLYRKSAGDREDTSKAFLAVASILRPLLSRDDLAKLEGTATNYEGWVDMVPLTSLHSSLGLVQKTLDRELTAKKTRFSWSLVRDHLEACALYYSHTRIEIRPLIPPTSTHEAFTNPKQRIYMSATLGTGGDLERITGRRKITRIPAPDGWDKQGIGQRLLVFPERSFPEEQTKSFIDECATRYNRVLYLAPNDYVCESVADHFRDELAVRTFSARQIEDSKTAFTESSNAAAVVSNRYDGIDFPGTDCRLVIFDGLPRGAGLQEQFIAQRMGARTVFEDRGLTRIVQGLGRCTRSSTDFSVVILIGDELVRRFARPDFRRLLHPELQAEIEFGLSESTDRDSTEELHENIQFFLDQTAEWNQAREQILDIRDEREQVKIDYHDELMKAVSKEITFQELMWSGQFLDAATTARQVFSLITHRKLQGYRSLWKYLQGTAHWLASHHKQTPSRDLEPARQCFSDALRANPGIRWLTGLASEKSQPELDSEIEATAIICRLEAVLDRLKTTHNREFDKFVDEIRDGLAEPDNPKRFERAHADLGTLLGYDAGNSDADGAPDPWWLVDSTLGFVFEDYTNTKTKPTLSVRKARQAESHPKWIKAELQVVLDDAKIVPILLTKSTCVKEEAMKFIPSLRYWEFSDFIDWANRAIDTVRSLRDEYPQAGDSLWRQSAVEAYRRDAISPHELDAKLSRLAKDAMTAV